MSTGSITHNDTNILNDICKKYTVIKTGISLCEKNRYLFIFMKMFLVIAITSLYMNANVSVFAQEPDFRSDLDSTEDTLSLYQKWLDDSGIGQVIKVQNVEDGENGFSLFLGFKAPYDNNASAVWNKLKSNFDNSNYLTLEQRLFYKMIHISGVKQGLAKINIYDTYAKTSIPDLTIRIYFDGVSVKSETTFSRSQKSSEEVRDFELKDNIRVAYIDSLKLNNDSNERDINDTEMNLRLQRLIFETIGKDAKEYFENKDKGITFNILKDTEFLRFEVINIHTEVLLDKLVNPYEYINFIIKYEPTGKGIKIICEVDLKCGPKFFRAGSRNNFKDVGSEYDKDLKGYAEIFLTEHVLSWLRR